MAGSTLAGQNPQAAQAEPEFYVGDRVVIVAGPGTGQIGTIDQKFTDSIGRTFYRIPDIDVGYPEQDLFDGQWLQRVAMFPQFRGIGGLRSNTIIP